MAVNSIVADEDNAARNQFFDMRAVITLILITSAAGMLIGFCTGVLVAPDNDIVKGALGSWFTLTALATQFYFGSNSQNKAKDDTNKAQAEALATMSQQAKPNAI